MILLGVLHAYAYRSEMALTVVCTNNNMFLKYRQLADDNAKEGICGHGRTELD